MTKPVIAYYRVSTNKQGDSGLGLEAQQRAVRAFCSNRDIQLIAEFTEIETGTAKKHRPKLHEALEICKRQKCPIIVSSADRLARNVGIMGSILNSGIEVLIADLPNADTFVINILASVAQKEAEAISMRTKSALRSARDRGVVLGKPENFTDEGRRLGVAVRRSRSEAADRIARELILAQRDKGASMQRIANYLNELGVGGRKWYPSQIHRILKSS
jgi:DNA invertase Pin-like site-specific DNA recombinase